MKKFFSNNLFKVLVMVTFVIGITAFVAYAHGPGGGYQGGYGHMMGGWGMGPGMMGGGYNSPGWRHGGYGHMMGNFSDGEIQQLDKERNAFFKETEDLRQKVYEKELALQSEFAKEKPDNRKAANLQKDISELRAQIDQKRINHMVEMRKINPNAGRTFMNRGGMGYGSSYGGYCWR